MSTNVCKNCGNPILIAIFRNGEWCCDDCRKVVQGEVQEKPLTR